jgi:exopolysaccharide biosynthesis polyprenyl glycosylphosphotransferase
VADVPTEIQRPPRERAPLRDSVTLPAVDMRRKRPPALSFLLRMETVRRAVRVLTLLGIDFAGLYAALFTALMVKLVLTEHVWAWDAVLEETRRMIAFAYLVTALLFARSGLYAARAQRPGLPRIVTSLFQVTVLALIFALVNGERYSSYYVFYGTLTFAIFYVGMLRWLYELTTGALLRAAGYRRRAVLVGSGAHIEDVAHAIGGEVHAPVEMVGFISLTPRPDNGLRSLGQIEDLGTVLDVHRVQEVIIADPDFPEDRAVELVDQCHQRGVTVRIAPSTMEILVHRAEFVPGASVPLFELRPPVFDGFDYVAKRSFDFVGALVIVLLFSPLLLVIALAVFVSSRGPVLYRSIRPGMGGEPFACFKFRTMRLDADQLQADLESENEATGPLFKIREDPRMTRVGTFLRRYSLDELPQLWNVLRGEMSIVGPRPLILDEDQFVDEWGRQRLDLKPGITGPWQVLGRSDIPFQEMVTLDDLYVTNWSLWNAVRLILKTLPLVARGHGR